MTPKITISAKNCLLWLLLAAIITLTGVYLVKEAEISGSMALQVFGGGNAIRQNTGFLDLLR